MKSRAVLASLFLGAALVLSSAQNADACFGLFGGCGCCEPSCCEPTCGCEPSCCAVEPTCGCELDCCDPCAPRCGLLSKIKGVFHRHNCCEPVCCEPTCCAPEPTCCAPEPSCCAVEPSCGCETDCCDPCCAPRCRVIEKLRGLFHRHSCCDCCEPTCGCEPSCCAVEPSCGCN